MIYVNTTLLIELLMYGIAYSFVVSVDSVNCFKNRLDNFVRTRILSMIYQADIHKTGNRSEVVF